MKTSRTVSLTSLLAATLGLHLAGCNNGVPGPKDDTPGTFVPCTDAQVLQNGVCVDKSSLIEMPAAYNFVGFRPNRAKKASIFQEVSEFRLLDSKGKVAYTGTATGPVKDTTGRDVWVADFTEFQTAGDYLLDFDGVPEDAAPLLVVHIGDKVFKEALGTIVTSFTGMRCGTAVSLKYGDVTFSHEACHEGDGDLKYAETEGGHQDATRGWHDAGDYGKYAVNGAFTEGMMLQAWERAGEKELGDDAGLGYQIPEKGGKMPDFLDEAKWQSDWLLGMQRADGAVYHKVDGIDFPSFIMPEKDTQTRYFAPISTEGTADTVAALAQMARVVKPFDSAYSTTCQEAALKGWQFLTDHPDHIATSRADFFVQLQYAQSDDKDDRLWAAAEIWETTGDADALSYFETNAPTGWGSSVNWDWGNVSTMGVLTYLHSARDGRDAAVVDLLTGKLLNTADSIVSNATTNPYGIGFAGNPYWGINGVIVRMTMVLNAAYTLTKDAKYLDAAIAQLDHVLGRNYYARSFVTGIGHAPPLHPHHRPSGADGIAPPWPGLLVGGPGNGPTKGWEGWLDDQNSAETNEVAINWNAPLVFAMSMPFDD